MFTVTVTVTQSDWLQFQATATVRATDSFGNVDRPHSLSKVFRMSDRDPNPADLAHRVMPLADSLAALLNPNLACHGYSFPFRAPDGLVNVIEFDYDSEFTG